MKNATAKIFTNRSAFLGLLIIILGFGLSFLSPYFFSITNLLEMTQFGAVLALLGLGQTLVIIGGRGGIDLSVGAVVSFSGVAMALLYHAGIGIWPAAICAILIGGLLGCFNGFLVATLNMPPLIVTLGTSYIFSSISLVITNGVPVSGFPAGFDFIGQGKIIGIPAQVLLIVIPVFILMVWIINKTTFGRSIYMVGVEDTAARLAGTHVKKVRFMLYVTSGLLAGLGAIVMSSWLMAAKPDIGTGYDMQSITVAVLGGTSMMGGEGSLSGTLLAVLIITMIYNGMQLANITSVWQLAVMGIVLLCSIIANNILESRSR
jgi:ribose/xylose/arabinose/galactoside ABC-type transport system permease subunit